MSEAWVVVVAVVVVVVVVVVGLLCEVVVVVWVVGYWISSQWMKYLLSFPARSRQY